MASKEELKNVVQGPRKGQLDKLNRLEDKVAAQEGGEGTPGKPKEPEPILTCVQCSAEYKESENAEGGCKYHSGELVSVDWAFVYSCCNNGSDSYDSARDLPGCTDGKHRSKHHTEYRYAAYNFYMNDMSGKIKQLWMTMDLEDHVTECCEWAEVGLSDEGKVFILVGSARQVCRTFAEFSSEELRQCKEELFTVFEMSNSAGSAIKAEIQSSNSKANAITVSIKPASSSIPLVKQIGLYFDGDVPMPGKVECLSAPSPAKPTAVYTVPEPTYEGPVLDPGVDYSKDIKNDYETETTKNCPLTLQQNGCVDVDSNLFKKADGKWLNFFATTLKVTNTSRSKRNITEVYGEYMNKAGKWVKCDRLWIGEEGWSSYTWFDSTSFSMTSASTKVQAVRLAIAISDDPPSNSYEACRAHCSLPQPLHMRVTYVAKRSGTASREFEQGNPPLDLATKESRKEVWKQVQFHLFADDTKKRNRSDATIYYDDDGALRYSPAPCGHTDFVFDISPSVATSAYKAKVAGKEEFELTEMKMEDRFEGSTVQIFAVVDLEAGVAYALKVVITTPTSSASGYYLLPYDDVSQASVTVEPQTVPVSGEFTVNWSVPRASEEDSVDIYRRYGRSMLYQEMVGMDGAATTGSIKLQAPDDPGQYEARYYPAWLRGSTTGHHHDGYWASDSSILTVTPA